VYVIWECRWTDCADECADTGDGFGNNGTGGARVSLDTEGLVLGDDGSYWISDEYGLFVGTFHVKRLTTTQRPTFTNSTRRAK
jgi:hypothetical protein